ncbi:MAG: methylenetetrahydrofolate--tRNA-(uracil(54)-C(5))-methyltransferase (FADH(2)-oxidizing) TrmFO [Anaerolineaceae bacterium]|nr:methylenetetrahydrofolate--tRNA-(uracil(54)-C(5))-methyltransferase (FADH(2)-oxidizing) TrmFO [Anaerolineaceae bacterium]
MNESAVVIGGGLAGSEAAWQLAQRGVAVTLYEMRPNQSTGAHVSDRLAELVCSNSLGSRLVDRASGLLQAETRRLGSLLLDCAGRSAVPAGGALAVDREAFAEEVTAAISRHPAIRLLREEVREFPEGPVIVATGPLTSPSLTQSLAGLAGEEHLYFYDAISPIVQAESIDMGIAFRASRRESDANGQGDYINCPLDESEYRRFVNALLEADRIELRDFEREDPQFFERCIPIEHLAERGPDTLAFGPMRPVGLRDPRTGLRPHAVVQLRQDNLAGSLYNIVGFQTIIRWGAQKEIFRMIPGLANAEFVRMGQIHRNTFLNAPALLNSGLNLRLRSDLFIAGQLTGVEGYVGNIVTGLIAAINLWRHLRGHEPWTPPRSTMTGSLLHYVSHADPREFQPMKANFGILPPLQTRIRRKRERYQAYAARALRDLETDLQTLGDPTLLSAESMPSRD